MSWCKAASASARIRLAAVVSLLVLADACSRHDDTPILYVTVVAGAMAPTTATRLHVEVDSGTWTGSHDFPNPNGGPLTFPTTFSLELPKSVSGPLRLEVSALDVNGVLLARGEIPRLELGSGRRDEQVTLSCPGCGDAGTGDGPADAGGDATAAPEAGRACGNGKLDDGELCDPGIGSDRPGGCPPANCDDGLACTIDIPSGTGCRLSCVHQEIKAPAAGDLCCPAGATVASDPDCSATCGNGTLEGAESCDTAIAAGQGGACPAATACDDGDPCTFDQLISAGTCSAVCTHTTLSLPIGGDRCCPPGASSDTDSDCPVVCGNGRKEAGETCDRGLASTDKDACPVACDDSDPCVLQVLAGSGCQVQCEKHPVLDFIPGDRCCPAGANRDEDPDCPARCGNGVLEPGEACDNKIAAGMPGACPSVCPPSVGGSLACVAVRLEGRTDDCSARCASEPVTICNAVAADDCCPSGCTSATDPDCSATCGNGALEPGEACDTAIAPGAPGACPSVCSDGNACTLDLLLSAGTCNAACAYPPSGQLASGDGCCPPGANALLDSDCPAVCGNSVVEPGEACEKALPAGSPGACAATCAVLPAGCVHLTAVGTTDMCTAMCQVDTVKVCQPGDGCCPAGCNALLDTDCPAICGNGVVEPGEACDRGLTAGTPGSCPAVCDDGDGCTVDTVLGRIADCTRSCQHRPIDICRGGDQCCPAGCSADKDSDCRPAQCGNGVVERGETCDPPSSCPSMCPDDGDPCTADLLQGDPTLCTAHCGHTPILACSGTSPDGCCPSKCTSKMDIDCGAPAAVP